jgi:acyl carrier protein
MTGRVRDFITDHLNGVVVEDDEDLLDGGHVNSLFVVQLVIWLERTFELTVNGGDLDIEHFRSIEAIASFVTQRSAPVGGVSA